VQIPGDDPPNASRRAGGHGSRASPPAQPGNHTRLSSLSLFIINHLRKNKASLSSAAKTARPMGRRLHIPILPNGQKDQEKLVDGVATVGSVSPMKAAEQSFVFEHPTLSQYYCSTTSYVPHPW
jgi:hypothetical protein